MSAKLTAKVEFEAYLWGASTGLPRKVIGSLREFVFAIEAEAVAAERARIAEAVRGLPDDRHDQEGLGCEQDATGKRTCYSLQRAAALAIIEAAPKP